ncbi:MAG TPA: class I SAM-dependent methyltransferase [Streptosporangiaceae bacterium]|nr:class I SAM-dependent methyltransferase [Streptosporangiaceae bacterium]
MTSQELSTTAMTAAAARAAHLIVDQAPFIFADTRAAAVLGEHADELITYHREHGNHPILSAARGQVICRSRYAEDRLEAAVARGVRQYVMLGAGLDTFAYRSPLAATVRVFEVDHPATLAWKRSALAAARLSVPGSAFFVPADLAVDSLSDALRAAGFAFGEPAVISWLGVLMYLDRDAISRTLADLSDCASGTELITDYMLPHELRDEAADQYVELVGPTAAEHGEPWLSFFTPTEVGGLLARHGFGATAHVSQRDAVPAALWQRTDALRPIDLSVIACARVGGP